MRTHFFSWIDYTCFIVISSLTCFIGLYFGVYLKPKTANEYIFGGKNMKWLIICLSFAASGFSTQTTIGLTTEIYLHGSQIVLTCVSVFLADVINYNFFLPVFLKLQVINVYQYLEMRFNRYLKNAIVFIGLFDGVLVLSLAIYAASLTFSQASGINPHTIAIIMTCVCIFYTSLGGVKAVVWADVLQLTITFSTVVILIVMGILSIGGIEILMKRASEGHRLSDIDFNPDPTVRMSFWTIMFGYTFTWSAFSCTTPSSLQKFQSVPRNTIKRLVIMHTLAWIIMKLTCLMFALVIYGKYFDCDPISVGEVQKSDQIVAYFITETTSHIPGFNGIFVAALFGSSLSLSSTLLNTLSGIIYFDVTQWFVPNRYLKSHSEVILMKIYVVIVGLFSIGVMYAFENVGTIFQIFYTIKAITSGVIFGIFILGLFIPLSNVKGAFCGGITSLVLISVIIIQNQIYMRNGLVKHVPKPLRTFGCNNTLSINLTSSLTAPINAVDEQPFWLFKISFQYYDLISTLSTVIIGSLISWLTRRKDDPSVNPEHLSPIVRKFYKPRSEYDVQLQESKLLNRNEQNSYIASLREM